MDKRRLEIKIGSLSDEASRPLSGPEGEHVGTKVPRRERWARGRCGVTRRSMLPSTATPLGLSLSLSLCLWLSWSDKFLNNYFEMFFNLQTELIPQSKSDSVSELFHKQKCEKQATTAWNWLEAGLRLSSHNYDCILSPFLSSINNIIIIALARLFHWPTLVLL